RLINKIHKGTIIIEEEDPVFGIPESLKYFVLYLFGNWNRLISKLIILGFDKSFHKIICPLFNAVSFQSFLKRKVSFFLLFHRHIYGLIYRIANLLHIIGVDNYGFIHFLGRTCHFT